jgi:hypothetical protein
MSKEPDQTSTTVSIKATDEKMIDAVFFKLSGYRRLVFINCKFAVRWLSQVGIAVEILFFIKDGIKINI